MNEMRQTLIVGLILAPWLAAIVFVLKRGGWGLLSSRSDLRSQAETLRAFGAS
jgi:hypothetical protein